MKWIPRTSAAQLARMLCTFPAVLVSGSRKCGKSTLVRTLYPQWRHLDLDRPVDLGLLSADIEGFLDANPRQVVIDEVQRLPALFNVLRHVIDRSAAKGRFLLLGSASPVLVRTAAGAEVDLPIRDGNRIVPIEIKLGGAIDRHQVAGLRQCMADLGLTKGHVVAYTREAAMVGTDIEVVPWADVVHRRVDFGLGLQRGSARRGR